MSSRRDSRRPLAGVLAIGVGLAVAPLAFQMFDRAPGGGRMIEGFRPYMTQTSIERFQGHLAEISAAHQETSALGAAAEGRYEAVAEFNRRWPTIDGDMGSMLETMRSEIAHYDGVAALPPFRLFPFFFLVPGLLAAGLALWTVSGVRRGVPTTARHRTIVGLGLAVAAAPLIFGMFTRAPGGARMIDEFRPMMTQSKVTTVQGYFLTIAAAEAQLRNDVVPKTAGASSLPRVRAFTADWPRISADMAPMIGTMADNLGNFEGVAALPPFWAFPWFFVAPGLLVAGLGALSHRRTRWAGPSGPDAVVTPASPAVERSLT
jgi:hypothetical protein